MTTGDSVEQCIFNIVQLSISFYIVSYNNTLGLNKIKYSISAHFNLHKLHKNSIRQTGGFKTADNICYCCRCYGDMCCLLPLYESGIVGKP